MIFRVILEFDSDKNEVFKGMTKERIVAYVEAIQPKDDSVSLVSISPTCERCKVEIATTTYATTNVCVKCCNYLDDEFDREMS